MVTQKQLDNLIPAKKGEVRNPNGKPKGTKHLSTYIQDLMFDEDFSVYLQDTKLGYVEYKGAPVKAIVATALQKAAIGDKDSREWLAKYGYGTKLELANNPENPISHPVDMDMLTQFMMSAKSDTKQ